MGPEGDVLFDKSIELAGYSYDPSQDIFYSNINPWQRAMGYCRLFDEAAAPLGMIIDCEPIYFEYGQKHWMIGLWKGQYDLVTGGEIGVYTGGVPFKIPFIKGLFYQCANDENHLILSFTLKKNGEVLFTRQGEHWWLTGFKLGEFSEPSELSMDIKITFDTQEMCQAFLIGIEKAGYTADELTIHGKTVSFTFDEPRTPQPLTRNKYTDWLIQRKNEVLCKKYEQLTEANATMQEKFALIEVDAPELYQRILKIGHFKQSYSMYESIWITTAYVAILLLALLMRYRSNP